MTFLHRSKLLITSIIVTCRLISCGTYNYVSVLKIEFCILIAEQEARRLTVRVELTQCLHICMYIACMYVHVYIM